MEEFPFEVMPDVSTPEGCIELCSRLQASGCPEIALGWAERACALSTEHGEAQLVLAECFMKLNCWSGAVAAFSRAVEIEGDNVTALYGLGTSLARMHRIKRAIETLEYARSLQIRRE